MIGKPELGIGLGYREELHSAILENRSEIDWLEIITDHYIDSPEMIDELRSLRARFPLIPHGLEMSIGSDSPLDMRYVESVAEVADAVGAPWFSDHLCFTRDGGVELDNLTPVLRTKAKAKEVAANAQRVQERVGRPFLLENITYYIDMPGELTEAELIAEVLEHCTCGLLLDLNNVVLNARNHSFDPYGFIDSLPLDRVVQVHLAGNAPETRMGDIRLDGHDAPVSTEVFDLLSHLADRQPLKGVMIERDDAFPDQFQEIIDDLSRARAVVAGGRPR